ncbi:hypothetical protein GCM10027089_40290 [Nocardia thraciensis]
MRAVAGPAWRRAARPGVPAAAGRLGCPAPGSRRCRGGGGDVVFLGLLLPVAPVNVTVGAITIVLEVIALILLTRRLESRDGAAKPAPVIP